MARIACFITVTHEVLILLKDASIRRARSEHEKLSATSVRDQRLRVPAPPSSTGVTGPHAAVAGRTIAPVETARESRVR